MDSCLPAGYMRTINMFFQVTMTTTVRFMHWVGLSFPISRPKKKVVSYEKAVQFVCSVEWHFNFNKEIFKALAQIKYR